MRIVWVTPRFWPSIGGVEKYVEEMGRVLLADDHQVTIVAAAHQPDLPDREARFGLEVLRLSAFRSRLRCLADWVKWRSVFEAADVVHISDILMLEHYHAMVGWVLPERPVFLTRHGLSYRCPVPPEERRRAQRASSLVQGTIDDGYFIAKWLKVPCDVVLDQGLRPLARDLPVPPIAPPHSAVFIGRLSWDSGITKYLDALEILDRDHGLRISLQVYGDGPLRQSLETRVEAARLPVAFHGFAPQAQDRIADGRFAFVSGRLAIQEAMARRRLVLAAYVNDLKRDYIVDEPFGPYVVVADSSHCLAERLRWFIEHPEQHEAAVQQAYDYACGLDWRKTADGYLSLWRNRTEASRNRRRWTERASLALSLASEFRP